jgi:hypothetical protein
MLRDHLPLLGEEDPIAQGGEGLLHQGGLIRRVEKDEVKGCVRPLARGQGLPHVRLPQRGVGVQATALEIGGDHATSRGMDFHKDHALGSSAQGFDTHGTAAGKEVEDPGPDDPVAEDSKERFAHPVRGGTQCHPAEGSKTPPFGSASDDTHDSAPLPGWA